VSFKGVRLIISKFKKNMYLSKLKLWNFRKFGSGVDELELDKPDLEIKFKKNINVLIGENDSGKTAVIDAIKLILKTHGFEWLKLERDDFFEDSNRLRIECIFEDLSDDEAKNFTEWLGIEDKEGNKYVFLRIILDATKNEDRVLPFDISAGVDDFGYPLTAEAKEYLKTTYLRPLRDAKNELIPKRNSRLSQILQGHEVFKGKNDSHELVKIFEQFGNEVENYFSTEEKDGKKIKDKIEEFLKEFFGIEKDSRFSITEQKLKNILETLRLTLEDGKLGLGSHNLLFMASELLNLEREDSSIKLALIEELEAHLHPQAQLRVVESLQNKSDIQFILTTHSPNLGSQIKLNNLFVCEEESANIFSMDHAHTKLDGSDYKFLEKFLDVTKANLFFAKGVILVEGWAEEILISEIAKKIDLNLSKNGVSVINVASTAFLRYGKIFQRQNEPYMKIPVAIITDIDVKPDIYKEISSEENTAQDINMVDKKRKKESYNGQTVKTFVSPEWTLEYCLFKSSSFGNKFQAIVKEIHSGTNFDNFEKTLCKKLGDKSLKKTEVAYRLVNSIKENEIEIEDEDGYIKYIIDAIKYASRKD
jgi:putative ATP-dependent endonuclease of OLD family